MSTASFSDVLAGKASILLGIRDEYSRGLSLANKRLRQFTRSSGRLNVLQSFSGRNLFAAPIRQFGVFSRTLGSFDRAFDGFSRTGSRLASSLTGAFSGVFAGLVLTKPIRDFSKLEQLSGRFRAVFRDSVGRADTFVKTLAADINQAPNILKDAASQFQSVFRGFGFEGLRAFNLTRDFTKLSQDLIAFDDTIQGPQEALDRLLGGVAGSNVRGVRRSFGADITQENLALEIQRLTLEEINGLTEQQVKVLARRNEILAKAELAGVTGQAKREVDTLASSFRAFAGEAEILSGVIGQSVAATVVKYTQQIVSNIRNMQLWIESHQGLTAVIYASAAALGTAVIGLSAFTIAGFAVGAVVRQVTALFSLLAAPIQLAVGLLRSMITTTLALTGVLASLGRVAFDALIASASIAIGALRTMIQVALSFVLNFSEIVTTVIAGVDAIGRSLSAALAVVSSVARAASGVGAAIAESFGNIVALITGVATNIAGIIGSLTTSISTIGLAVLDLAVLFSLTFGSIAASAATLASAFAPVLLAIGAVAIVGSTLIGVFEFLQVYLSSLAVEFGNVSRQLTDLVGTISGSLSVAFSEVLQVARDVWERITSAGINSVARLLDEIKGIGVGIGDAIAGGDIETALRVAQAGASVMVKRLQILLLELGDQVGPRMQATFEVLFEEIGRSWVRVVGAMAAAFRQFTDPVIRFTRAFLGVFGGGTALLTFDTAANAANNALAKTGTAAANAFNAALTPNTDQLLAKITQREKELRDARGEGNAALIAEKQAELRAAEQELDAAKKKAEEARKKQEEERRKNVAGGGGNRPVIEPVPTSPAKIGTGGIFGGSQFNLNQLLTPSGKGVDRIIRANEKTKDAVDDVAETIDRVSRQKRSGLVFT